jgi:AcrR family transcriptional regulator
VDGRHLRRQQNRDAVVDALLAFQREGRYDASAAEIATRAGLSPRSLFRYFDDVDDLSGAAIAHEQERARKIVELDVGPGDPLDERIAALVESRLALWEAVGTAARASRMRAPVSAVVQGELSKGRRFLRQQLAELFATELAARPVLAVLDVLCSFESWDLLRHDQRLSRSKAAAALADAIRTLLRGE